MIIWIASYPRSGNTLLRQFLKTVWNQPSYSAYPDDNAAISSTASTRIAHAIGHESLGKPFPDVYRRLCESDETHFVKTHEIPIDNQKSIYVVRDGRAASRSFCSYRCDISGRDDHGACLRDIILGLDYFGSWSNHLDLWTPLDRDNTLLVKYENLIDQPDVEVDRIAEFIRMKPLNPWKNGFNELAKIEPRLFRAASKNRPEMALDGIEEDLFWMLHSGWMRRLEYVPADFTSPVVEIPESFRRHFYMSTATLSSRIARAELRAEEYRLKLQATVGPSIDEPRQDAVA